MQYDHVLKKLNLQLLTSTPGSGGGVCEQNICYHVAAFVIPFNLIFQHDIVLKKLNFDLLTPSVRGKGGSAGKLFATVLLHS